MKFQYKQKKTNNAPSVSMLLGNSFSLENENAIITQTETL